ncbi:PaaI family thioesterase [Eupransor demetentiae]|uniref:Contains HGG motif (PaaI) n=1 Tax=Eupransor demetentiae TaxID=3109584 RepID=A0ABM9N540_9LACO|nr:Acyl-CoA thioesterase PaaI [Lactobacillaceae bacterium LMG 33000]
MNILELLGINVTKVTSTEAIVTVNVTKQLQQPYGLMHGGMNALLAETAASLGANAILPENQVAVGVDVQTHHLRPVSQGILTAKATPIKVGREIQVWECTIFLEETGQKTSFSTITLKSQSI